MGVPAAEQSPSVTVLAIIIGVVLLAVGADWFVTGAAGMSRRFGVNPTLIGALVIGFGTSAPELLASVMAGLSGELDVALGNVIGSNTANLSLVLGGAALLAPIAVADVALRREGLLCLAATGLLTVMLLDGGLGRIEGLLLVASMLASSVIMIRAARRRPPGPLEQDTLEFIDEQLDPPTTLRNLIGRTVAGLAATVGGAHLLLTGALDAATTAGLSGGFVGVTIVAVGTALPEIFTSLHGARRGETELVVGNVLGSNLFNTLLVAGTTMLIAPGPVDRTLVYVAAPLMLLLTVATITTMWRTKQVTRRAGVLLLVGFVAISAASF
jgi:cation:H+ antiporter